MDKDYAATPLWKKLGIKEDASFAIVGAPADVAIATPAGARRLRSPGTATDVILVFETGLMRLKRSIRSLRPKLAPAGGLWVAYPKKSSGLTTDLTFENVQGAGLEAGLVDNKSCAIDGNWTAVRFVVRLKDRPV